MITLLESINTELIVNSYTEIEKAIQWTDYGFKGRQAGLQYKDDEDPWSSAVGKSQGNELAYTKLNPFFKDTIFEDLIVKYNLSKTRLMWVGPWACYSMHRDETPRIHVPMITNPECYFVFRNGKITHLHKDAVWMTDTTLMHTFMNCSDQHRLHLVGAVKSTNF